MPLSDGRGKHGQQRKKPEAIGNAIKLFITNLDSRESHYSRDRNENRKFLPANTTKIKLFHQFCDQNPQYAPNNNNDAAASYSLFCKIFECDFNIAIGFPRSDLCDTCELYNTRILAATREANLQQIQELREARERHWDESQRFYDQIRRINELPNSYLAICADFEKNFNFPITGVNREYFLSNMNLYNFGIQNMKTNDAHMIMYSQTFARKGANETATFLHYYLTEVCDPVIRHVKLYMDNSTGTNKNRFVLAMLHNLCLTKFESIEIIFPIVGHSYMPIDRSFAMIEKKKKREDKITTPEQWTNLVRLSRPTQPFNIIHVEHPMTNSLRPDETIPILRVIDFKTLFAPMLGRQLYLQQARKILITRDLQLMMSRNLNEDCLEPINLFLNHVTIDNLLPILGNPPLAYEDILYLPVSASAARSVNIIKQYIDQPVQFFDTIS